MSNKIELEFSEGNYAGSKVFSSLADVLGLSVDLVSFVCQRRPDEVLPKIKNTNKTGNLSHPPTHEKSDSPSHIAT